MRKRKKERGCEDERAFFFGQMSADVCNILPTRLGSNFRVVRPSPSTAALAAMRGRRDNRAVPSRERVGTIVARCPRSHSSPPLNVCFIVGSLVSDCGAVFPKPSGGAIIRRCRHPEQWNTMISLGDCGNEFSGIGLLKSNHQVRNEVFPASGVAQHRRDTGFRFAA